jgi:hypothetical protein
MAVLTWLLYDRVPCVGLVGSVTYTAPEAPWQLSSHSILTFSGFPFAFGVFEDYYATNPLYSENTSGLAVVGTASTAMNPKFPSAYQAKSVAGIDVSKCASDFWPPPAISGNSTTVIDRWFHRRYHSPSGCLLCLECLYSPTIFCLDKWFIKRKGLAFGIMWAGTGVSGLVLLFIL